MINSSLDSSILTILKQGSLSVYDLIKTLQHAPYEVFNQDIFDNDLAMFQSHFMVQNSLYRLRDLGLEKSEFDIDILPTKIQLLTFSDSASCTLNTNTHPETYKLREYYLNWQNFTDTQLQDVEMLLEQFWTRYSKFIPIAASTESLQRALDYFELQTLPSDKELKSKYKRLSKIHHPDKGGNAENFKLLQHYYSVLTKAVK